MCRRVKPRNTKEVTDAKCIFITWPAAELTLFPPLFSPTFPCRPRAATKTVQVLGVSAPYSISGSLPLVRWLQDQGYDVQICGYGLSSRCELRDPSFVSRARRTDIISFDVPDILRVCKWATVFCKS